MNTTTKSSEESANRPAFPAPRAKRLALAAAIGAALVLGVRAPTDHPAPSGGESPPARPADVDMARGRIVNLGLVDAPEPAGFSAAPYRGMSVSAGQLMGVHPETGLPLTAYYQLLPLMVRSLSAAAGIDAAWFSGDGSMLSNLSAGAISAGRLPAAALPGSGTWDAGGMTIRGAEISGVKDLHVDGRLSAGVATTVAGENAAAFGERSAAQGTNSVAFGMNARALGGNSAAFGRQTIAGGRNSAAFGDRSRAGGANSAAFGFDTRADGAAGMAIGSQTAAAGARSFAGGQLARARHANSFVWSDGTKGTRHNDGDYIVSSRTNEFTVYASGGIRLLGGPVIVEPAGDLSMGAFTRP